VTQKLVECNNRNELGCLLIYLAGICQHFLPHQYDINCDVKYCTTTGVYLKCNCEEVKNESEMHSCR
jgi:hypothetical protein